MKSQGLVKHRSQVCLHSVGEPPRLCDVLLGGGDGGEVVQLQEGEGRPQEAGGDRVTGLQDLWTGVQGPV